MPFRPSRQLRATRAMIACVLALLSASGLTFAQDVDQRSVHVVLSTLQDTAQGDAGSHGAESTLFTGDAGHKDTLHTHADDLGSHHTVTGSVKTGDSVHAPPGGTGGAVGGVVDIVGVQEHPPVIVHSPDSPVTTWHVFWMTVVMAAASGFGAAPYFFIDKLSKQWAAAANAIACGVMLAASFELLHESEASEAMPMVLGLVVGCFFIKYLQQWLGSQGDIRLQGLPAANSRKILLFVGIMAAHAVGEGAGVGVSFCGSRGWRHGILVTLAIGIHNIPEGLACATVLVARGTNPRQALQWTLLCALPQAVFAVPSFVFVETFKALLPASTGFAAGCMIWIVVAELLPEALEDMDAGAVASTVTLSTAMLELMRVLLSTVERPTASLAAYTPGDSQVIHRLLASAVLRFPLLPLLALGVVLALRVLPPRMQYSQGVASVGLLSSASVGIVAVQSLMVLVDVLRGGGVTHLAVLGLWALGGTLGIGLYLHQRQMVLDAMCSSLPDDVETALAGHAQDVITERAGRSDMMDSWDRLPDVVLHSTGSPRSRLDGPEPPKTSYAIRTPPTSEPRAAHAHKPAQHQQLAIIGGLVLLVLVGLEVVGGWRRALAHVSDPRGPLQPSMLLSVLQLIPTAVALAGVAPMLVGRGQARTVTIAVLLAIVGASAEAMAVLQYPAGVRLPTEVPFDPSNWTIKVSAVVSGAGAAVSIFVLGPFLVAENVKQALHGVVVGVCLALSAAFMARLA